MFGGVGLYSDELFFGLIDDDTLFFKTDESNIARYRRATCRVSCRPANRPMGPMGYHQVPADVIEDAEALVAWARKSVAVALAHRRPRRGSRAPRETKRTGREEDARRSGRAQVRAQDIARFAPARCGPDPPATPPAPNRSSRGTGRRAYRPRPSCRRWRRRARRASAGIANTSRCGAYNLPSSRCQSAVGSCAADDHDLGRREVFVQRFEQAHVAMRKAIDRQPARRAACVPRPRASASRRAGTRRESARARQCHCRPEWHRR